MLFRVRAKLLRLFFFFFSFCTVSLITKLCSQWELHAICAVCIKAVAEVQTSNPGFDLEAAKLFSSIYTFATVM